VTPPRELLEGGGILMEDARVLTESARREDLSALAH
jgi:hypothetical protein